MTPVAGAFNSATRFRYQLCHLQVVVQVVQVGSKGHGRHEQLEQLTPYFGSSGKASFGISEFFCRGTRYAKGSSVSCPLFLVQSIVYHDDTSNNRRSQVDRGRKVAIFR